MKKNTLKIGIIAIILIVAGIAIFGKSSSTPTGIDDPNNAPVVPSSETVKVSGNLSEYHNSELGFSVKYPSSWEAEKNDTGIAFLMPLNKSEVSTIAKLRADIFTSSGKCTFPPITTVKDRDTLVSKDLTFNMISMSNTVQGRTYFNRMYSLQKDNICYNFSLSTITMSTSASNLSGSNLTQAQNNNKAIINTFDTAFTEVVKSFTLVSGPQGIDETKAPKK